MDPFVASPAQLSLKPSQLWSNPAQLAVDPAHSLDAAQAAPSRQSLRLWAIQPGADAFPIAADEAVADPGLLLGKASQLANIVVLLVTAAPLCLALPDWLRATAIGCIWGALSLAGLCASWSRRRLLSGIYALCLAQLAQQSLRVLGELDHHSAWALVSVVLGGGWGVGLVWTPWLAQHRQPLCIATSHAAGRRLNRWSMWDIGCLATGVAVLCWVVPRTEAPLHLICQIAPALVGGLLVSLLAVEWACRDHWSLRRLLAVVICGPIACGVFLWFATATTGLKTLGWQAVFSWWLAGPGSVMAAQGLTVLAYLAAARVDMHLAATNRVANRLDR